jgi:hypothetical protein
VITKALTPVLKLLADNFEAVGRFAKAFALGITVLMIPAFIALVPVIAGATKALLGMAAAFSLTPFGAALTAITAVSAALAWFGDVTVKIGGYSISVWTAFTTAVSVAWDILKIGIGILTDLFGGGVTLARDFFSMVLGWLGDFTDGWGSMFTTVGGWIKEAINTYIGLYVGMVKAIGPSITEGIPALFNIAMGKAKNAVIIAVQFIVNQFAKAVGGIGDALAFIPGVADDLGDSIRGALTIDLDDVKAPIDQYKAELASAGASIQEAFGSGQVDYVGAVGDAFVAAGDSIGDRFTSKLGMAAEDALMAQEVLTGLASSIEDPLVPAVDAAAAALGGSGGGLSKALKDTSKEATTWRSSIDDAMKSLGESVGTEADLAGGALESAFGAASKAIVDFATTGKLDFKEFARSVAADILQMTTKLLLLKALKSLIGGFAEGGEVGFATGGLVRGKGTGTSDSIPARLSNGEFVVNARATDAFRPLLEKINNGEDVSLAAGGAAMAGGSSLAPPKTNPTNDAGSSAQAAPQVNVVAQIADADVVAAFNNPDGEQVIIGMLQRNKQAVQGVLNG